MASSTEKVMRFEDKFGAIEPTTIQDSLTVDAGLYLPIPTEKTSLDDLHSIALTATAILSKNASVSVALGDQMDTRKVQDPELAAMNAMSPLQREMYEAWKNGMRLPSCTIPKDAMPGVISSTQAHNMPTSNAAKVKVQIAAFKALYKTPVFTDEQRKYVLIKNPAFGNLMVAMMKVIKARKDATSGVADVTPEQFAEIQACKKMIATMGSSMNTFASQLKVVTAATHHATQLLQSRLNALPNLSKGGKTVVVPLEAARKAMGGVGSTVPLDLSLLTAGKRMARTSVSSRVTIPTKRASDKFAPAPQSSKKVKGKEAVSAPKSPVFDVEDQPGSYPEYE
jgi:hypothetical protein